MGELKEVYQIHNLTKADINSVLVRLTNRLDKIEGYRDTPTFQAPLEFASDATLESPTINTPSISGGTLSSPTITNPTITGLSTEQAVTIAYYNSNTGVFDDVAPQSWTDLDLSAAVGANYALVILRIYSPTYGNYAVFRVNGEAKDCQWINAGGSNVAFISGGGIGYALCATDSAGIVEWKAAYAWANTTVTVVSYIKTAE